MWRRQLLDPHGENPLKAMQVTGEVKRVRTPRMGFVLEMLDSSPPTKLLMPKPSAPRLNLRHRYLVVEVRTDFKLVLPRAEARCSPWPYRSCVVAVCG